MEKILRIEDTVFSHGDRYSNQYEGFVITTDRQTIKVGVSNSPNCCESWGHVASVDNLDEFIGSNLNNVSVVDTALNEKTVKSVHDAWVDEGGVMYVNFDTSAGILQLTVYNSHNGYYGHQAIVVSEQIQHEVVL